MEPSGFRLWSQNVIFKSSHVEGGVEGPGQKVGFRGGRKSVEIMALVLTPLGDMARMSWSLAAADPLLEGDWGRPVFPFFALSGAVFRKGSLPGPWTGIASKF